MTVLFIYSIIVAVSDENQYNAKLILWLVSYLGSYFSIYHLIMILILIQAHTDIVMVLSGSVMFCRDLPLEMMIIDHRFHNVECHSCFLGTLPWVR